MMTVTRLVFFTCALILTMSQGRLYAAEASNAFNEAVKNQRAGKYKEAIAAYDRAIKADPKKYLNVKVSIF